MTELDVDVDINILDIVRKFIATKEGWDELAALVKNSEDPPLIRSRVHKFFAKIADSNNDMLYLAMVEQLDNLMNES